MHAKLNALITSVTSSSLHVSDALSSYVTTDAENDNFTHTLTVSGQALTPFILKSVLQALEKHFAASFMTFHHLHNVFGDSVVTLRGELLSADVTSVKAALGDLSSTYNIDIGIQASRPSLSQPGLLVMDMDSTVIAIECIDEIAVLAGVGEQVAEVTARAMRGEIAFNDSLVHRVACLDGVPLAHLEKIRNRIPLMPGIQTLVQTLQKHNWKLAIASGGFTYFADYLKTRLGLDYAISNTLGVNDGNLNGKVEGEIINAEVKARTVKTLAEKWQIPKAQTVAMGDGANDLVMMAESALGVACHGKPLVNEKADVAIRVGTLHSMLYFLEG